MFRIGAMVSCVLVVMTVVVYWQVPDLGFVGFDDPVYLAPELPVWEGLTSESMRWMFTESYHLNWHPVTWLSYMLDMKLFGMDYPGGFHVTNVIIHTANVLLLFFTLWKMSNGDIWKSAFVAAVFAVHPLHVESVAWISERKDVLSTFFGLLAILAYVYHAQRRQARWLWAAYAAFALSLMSKQMFVTLPFLLLLLDYWPLGRLRPETNTDGNMPAPHNLSVNNQSIRASISWPALRRLILEKWPFFLLTITACVIAVLSQEKVIVRLDDVTLSDRFKNVVVVYVLYIVKTIWPSGLAVYYPFPASGISMIEVGLSGTLLIGITVIACRQAVRHPYLLIGWLWYLGTLVPVVGIVQIGTQRMADRYTYLPGIGLSIIAAWLIPALFPAGAWRRRFLPVVTVLILLAFMVVARKQTTYWKDGVVLFERVLDAVGPNAYAHYIIGSELENQNRPNDVIRHYRAALSLDDNFPICHYSLGTALAKQRKIDEAIFQFREAVRLAPHYGDAHSNLGSALASLGRHDEAITHFRHAAKYSPNRATSNANLGNAYCRLGRFDEGIRHYKIALQHNHSYARAHLNLGHALLQTERFDAAIEHFREARQLDPGLTSVDQYISTAEQQRLRKPDSVP
jgi:Tfp pilus assembly protein PilF